jgi:Ca2+-binding RTX toxin-like protein
VSAFARRVVLDGDDGRNRLRLAACDGTVRGRGGKDSIGRAYDIEFDTSPGCEESLHASGGSGADTIAGTRGDDLLVGNGGDDRVSGGFGDDRVRGSRGRDVLRGQTGRDVLAGGPGRDVADGGPGSDRCRAEQTRRCERR